MPVMIPAAAPRAGPLPVQVSDNLNVHLQVQLEAPSPLGSQHSLRVGRRGCRRESWLPGWAAQARHGTWNTCIAPGPRAWALVHRCECPAATLELAAA